MRPGTTAPPGGADVFNTVRPDLRIDRQDVIPAHAGRRRRAPTRQRMSMSLGFGTWRLFLALLVGASHLWVDMVAGPAAYAVWGFFVLSGYLMTHVLSTKYGFSARGLAGYAHNRFPAHLPRLLDRLSGERARAVVAGATRHRSASPQSRPSDCRATAPSGAS
ncbi:MAG: hypothetical protein LKM39_00445 [Chiayiivirga sp.]|jgi:hypothetical protein|nr:hypothetical protein [Chiayiivirga sp.]